MSWHGATQVSIPNSLSDSAVQKLVLRDFWGAIFFWISVDVWESKRVRAKIERRGLTYTLFIALLLRGAYSITSNSTTFERLRQSLTYAIEDSGTLVSKMYSFSLPTLTCRECGGGGKMNKYSDCFPWYHIILHTRHHPWAGHIYRSQLKQQVLSNYLDQRSVQFAFDSVFFCFPPSCIH